MYLIRISLLLFITNSFICFGQDLTAKTTINPMTISSHTGEKPQSKTWNYDTKWWAVMPDSSGTYIWELKLLNQEYQWIKSLKISESSKTYADCKLSSNLIHILLFDKSTLLPKTILISMQYDDATNSYTIWNENASPLHLDFNSATIETATIDMDDEKKLWMAYEQSTKINVRWSDYPYANWSDEITLYEGVHEDDICAIVHLNNKIGVLWSNQNTHRFGFRTHQDSDDPSIWSTDEVPASESAKNIGLGMADDHLNMAVSENGTLYCAVKTSYDTVGYTQIGFMLRLPNGNWSELYNVSDSGTRPIVILNELSQKLKVLYSSSKSDKEIIGDILYKESDINNILFGNTQILIDGSASSYYNNVSSSKNNYTSEIVVLASKDTTLVSIKTGK